MYFPDPLPDETIFSLLCRFYFLAAHSNFRNHTLPLLGINGSRGANEFPSFLPQLSEISGIGLPYLINQMTCIHYFQPFISEREYDRVYQSLITGNTINLQTHLGMVANRITSGKSLKYCPLCALADAEQYGTTYWHQTHQLVGITVCHIHNCHLLTIGCRSQRVIMPKTSEPLEMGIAEEYKLSRLIYAEFTSNKNDLCVKDTYSSYAFQMRELGFITGCGHIRQQSLHSYLHKKIDVLLSSKSLLIQYITKQMSKGQYPECLFYHKHAIHQPIKHLLFIYALFESWPKFINVSSRLIEPQLPDKDLSPQRTDWSEAIACLMRGESLRSVSKRYSTTVHTLKVRAQQRGVVVDTRPSKLFKSEQRQIWWKLLIGIKTQVISSEFNVSVGAIEKVLTRYPDLKVIRKRMWYLADFRHHQQQLLTYLSDHSDATRNDIKKSISASYAWLYKHEKPYLYSVMPKRIKAIYWPRKSNKKTD